MSYILLVLYLLVIIVFIVKSSFFRSGNFPSYVPVLVFIIKFLAGVSVYIIYAKYYGDRHSSDIFKYFDDGNIIFSSIYFHPYDYLRMVTGIDARAPELGKYYNTCSFWIKNFNYGLFNDNRTVIRFNAIVRLFSLGNIHIHTLLMSFLSFTGLWGIFNVFVKFFKGKEYFLLLAVFFFPSVMFWTSGVLKEGILMFAFGMLIYHFRQMLDKRSIRHLIFIILFTGLLLISKFYVFVAVLPGLLFVFVISKSGRKYFYIKLVSVLVLFFVTAWFSDLFLGVSFPEVLAHKQNDFVAYVNSLNKVGSRIDIPVLKPDFMSIAKNSPSAFFRTLMRPTVFEVNSAVSLMAALENLIILLFMFFSLLFFTKKYLKNEWFWLSLTFVIVLFTLSGLTTPVLGALVRYKAPALPFLGIVILFLMDIDRIGSFKKKHIGSNC